MNRKALYEELLLVCKKSNKSLNIVPVLYGSLGLVILTGVDFSPQDIDILVPKRFIDEEWPLLIKMMQKLGYMLVDLHEHKFKLGFAFEEDLPLSPVFINNHQPKCELSIIIRGRVFTGI